jgi:hypothetical protein
MCGWGKRAAVETPHHPKTISLNLNDFEDNYIIAEGCKARGNLCLVIRAYKYVTYGGHSFLFDGVIAGIGGGGPRDKSDIGIRKFERNFKFKRSKLVSKLD